LTLGNFAVISLIFGQAVAKEALNWRFVTFGLAIFTIAHIFTLSLQNNHWWGRGRGLFLGGPSPIEGLRPDFTAGELWSATSKRRQHRAQSASNLPLGIQFTQR